MNHMLDSQPGVFLVALVSETLLGGRLIHVLLLLRSEGWCVHVPDRGVPSKRESITFELDTEGRVVATLEFASCLVDGIHLMITIAFDLTYQRLFHFRRHDGK